MLHFIKVYIVCQDKNDLQIKKCNFYMEIITCDTSVYTMDHPKFIVSNQKEESISVSDKRIRDKKNYLFGFMSGP